MSKDGVISKIKNRLYYFKLVVSFTVLSMVVVITMSIVFSNIYKNELVNNAEKDYLNSIDGLNASIENIFKQVEGLFTYIQVNRDIYYFLNADEDDMSSKIKAQDEATRIRYINPYVQSIFLYNAGIDCLLSTGFSSKLTTQTTDSLVEPQINELFRRRILESDLTKKRNIIRINFSDETLKNSNNSENSVFQRLNDSYILSMKYINLSMDRKLQSSILINIDGSRIQRELLSFIGGNTMLIDETGSTIIAGKEEKTDSKTLTGIIESTLSKDKERGSFKFSNNKDTYIITYVKSNLTSWYLINFRTFNSSTEAIENKETLLNVICIAILLAFITISYFVSSRLYIPIRKVVEALKSKTPFISDSKNGELPLILNVVDETLKRMGELKDKNDENEAIVKENLLRSLILSDVSEDEQEKLIQGHNLEISFDNLILVTVKIDNDKLYKESNTLLIETMVCAGINETLKKNFYCQVVRLYQGKLCILMNFRNKEFNSFELLLTELERMKDFVNNLIGATITVGIGGVVNGIHECNTAYKKANHMIKYRFVLGMSKVIYQRYIEDNLQNGLIYPKELKDKLLVSLRMNNKEEFEDTLDRIIGLLRNYVYEDVVVVFLKLLLDCIEEINEITGKIKRVEFDFEEFNNIFLEMLTLEHAKGWLLSLFSEYQITMEKISSIKDDKFYQIVENAKEYIQENYVDINLGVDMLAEKMGYSPKYFSKIFKDITGKYLSDYIRQVRINKAKELLQDQVLKINEISNMIGFVNSNYFYSAFKNEVGFTPSEFKKFYLKTEEK